MKIRTFLIAIAMAAPLLAADYQVELKPGNTKINWTLGDVLHTVHGTFALRSGSLKLNPETGKASGQVIVDVASGNSGNDARDKRMRANVLESGKYPEATFIPASIEGALAIPGTSKVKLHGSLTIHGTSHEITMDAETTSEGDQMHAVLTFDIPYVAWGMKDPGNILLKVNKTVSVSIDASATLQKH